MLYSLYNRFTPTREKMEKTPSYMKTIFDFFNNISIHGPNLIIMKNNTFLEKIFWTIFNICVIYVSTNLILHLLGDFFKNPNVLTLGASNIIFQNIKFPGIAVCSVNKISRKKALLFAEYLNHFEKSTKLTTLLEDIQMLGKLYDFTEENKNRTQIFQDFLDKFDNLTDSSDPTLRMLQLSPHCEDMFLECKWGRKQRDCLKLFQMRMTFEGFCCVFNYARKSTRSSIYDTYSLQNIPTYVKVAKGAGYQNGLILSLRNTLDDYFFTTLDTTGYNIHIFYPHDFPDKISGSLSEVIVNFGTESMISVNAKLVKPTNELSTAPYSLRMCRQESDESTIFGKYRNSDCFVACKVESIVSLCGCIPFFLPLEKTVGFSGFCTLVDLPCLNKYEGKWNKFYPSGVEIESLEWEKHNSLSCSKCLPACNNILYEVNTNVIPISQNTNRTKVYIFLDNPFGDSFTLDLTMTWYEILSSFGGALSLMFGFSLVGAVEILLLLLKLVYYFFHKIFISIYRDFMPLFR